MKVCILISIPDPKYFDNCTLVFKTLRVGFPTADVWVTINGIGAEDDQFRATQAAASGGVNNILMAGERLHHADWIEATLKACSNKPGPLIFLDGDVQFWSNCEDWKFTAPMAGYYVPEMFNDWAQCRSVPRLHTSLLWFSHPQQMLEDIRKLYPLDGEYAPLNLFKPSVQYINGEPIFWDTCAGLYNAFGGAYFGPQHTACYDHLNSAGFVEEMVKRMGGRTGEDFRLFHSFAPQSPNMVRDHSWPLVGKYYDRKRGEAAVMPDHFRWKFDRMLWLA